MGGAEFYPACSQLQVGGTGTGKPQESELVSLYGAYSDSDPGTYDPTVFNPSANYTFPGPPTASFVISGGGGGDDSDNGYNSGSGSGGSGSGSSKTSTSSPPKCLLKTRASSPSSNDNQCPLSTSRVIRDFTFGCPRSQLNH
jgi:hypothetical protein